MKDVKTMLFLFAALTLAFAFSPALAQEEGELLVMEGKLMQVDPDAQVITLRTETGAEVEFHYSAATEVQGSEEGVAGLAGSAGNQLRVHYLSSDGIFVAERIEVIG